MKPLRSRYVLPAAACAGMAVAVATVLVLVFSGDSEAAPTKVEYLAQVAAVCRVYGPQLDKIPPPDVSVPANVIVAIRAVFPLLEAQQREVRALRAPEELRATLARWLDLHDRRLGMLEDALRAGQRDDLLAMSVAYPTLLRVDRSTRRYYLSICAS